MSLILSWLGSLLGGPFIKAALDAYRAKLANDSNADQRTSDLMSRELSVEQREQEIQGQTIIAEQGRWWTALPRPLFAAPFIVYVWMKVIIDDSFHVAVVSGLDPEMAGVFKVVLTAYFGGRSLEKVARILARK